MAERLRWQDRLLLDKGLTDFQVRVALLVARAIDKETGVARISAERVAERMGLRSDRGVQKAIAALAGGSDPYIEIERREVGVDARGRKVFGGRGGSNMFQLRIPELAVNHELECVLPAPQSTNGGASSIEESTNPQSAKHERRSSAYREDPVEYPKTRGRAPAKGAPRAIEAPQLGEHGERLRTALGGDAYESWFGGARLESRTDMAVTISVPSLFRAQEIRARFSGHLAQVFGVPDAIIVQRNAPRAAVVA